jgi:signal peptidase I
MTVLLVSVVLLPIVSIYPVFEITNYDKKYLHVSTAYGYSMYPTIKNGDLLIIALKSSPYYNPEIGDILIYKHDGFYIAHRLLQIRESFYIVKGDNNDYFEQIPKEDVVGEVIKVVPQENLIAYYLVKNLIKQ